MIEAIYLALRAGLVQGLTTVFGASMAATLIGGAGAFVFLKRRTSKKRQDL